ncbi:MAG TPA: hypothetical protein VFN26_01245 [Candidatus Acidoferrum sp.]|nr:hypothetical protein [Candidatus Acidoferrum sp.]
MLTLFPSPAPEPPKPEPNPIPRRLQLLPVAMLTIAVLLNFFAWHRNNVSHADPAAPVSADQSANMPSHPGPARVEDSRPSSAEQAHESQKVRQAKNRAFQLYTSPDYGITFSYPRSYAFKGPSEVAEEANALLQQRTDGSPDQQLLVRIELPDNVYPRTDFLAGYFSLSVNPALTAAQCSQAIGAEEEDEADTLLIDGIAFHSLQTAAGADGTHTSWREYAGSSGGVCYEIELGVVTVNDGSITPVNEERVFHRLDAILRTIKIANPQ